MNIIKSIGKYKMSPPHTLTLKQSRDELFRAKDEITRLQRELIKYHNVYASIVCNRRAVKSKGL